MEEVLMREEAPVRADEERHKKLEVCLKSITALADDVNAFEFTSADGRPLPEFTAGSHIDVHLPDGAIRQYSLCNPPGERNRYVIAVLRDPQGRGGSIAMHDELRAGQKLRISQPRNHFALSTSARRHVFVAGGIGITPVMAMIAEVQRRGEAFHVYYCARSAQRAAFLDELKPLIDSGDVSVHFDNGDPRNGLDLVSILRQYMPGTHLYYCGPGRLMDAIEAATVHWPPATRHCERFSAGAAMDTRPDSASKSDRDEDVPFDVELHRSHKTFTVRPGESIVDVLRCNGVEVDTSCCEGYCGTCMTRYLAGEPLHRDTVLDEEDREAFLMICCARAKSPTLVLDI
ncbi:2Fe-2S iron-sulfur cluster binding domain-containing protein [Paraburkholderia sp. NMBU_R16]|uniref:PDR/VanB family oxidoreductase n=1 Tax=Paraburkholderia sp. NMBU_R16 TaxID=2698676 RepID=UPI001563E16B|nr:PDR/VanB family oxidoreductase [Paraburkholderia sp. NMBU_R16]NRO96438.1 2Fe-2S iron-sulfur cluster binding domain-containing protein [Paraburkholderia sp. NMBU_R16]